MDSNLSVSSDKTANGLWFLELLRFGIQKLKLSIILEHIFKAKSSLILGHEIFRQGCKILFQVSSEFPLRNHGAAD